MTSTSWSIRACLEADRQQLVNEGLEVVVVHDHHLTANPSLDRTEIPGRRCWRAARCSGSRGHRHEPGGRSTSLATRPRGHRSPPCAVFGSTLMLPAAPRRARAQRPVAEGVRMNLTLTEPDGTTTKLNEPGPLLTDELVEQLAALVVDLGQRRMGRAVGLAAARRAPRLLRHPGAQSASVGRKGGRRHLRRAAAGPGRQLSRRGPRPAQTQLGRACSSPAPTPNNWKPRPRPATRVQRSAPRAASSIAASERDTLGARAVLVTSEGAWHAKLVAPRSTVGGRRFIEGRPCAGRLRGRSRPPTVYELLGAGSAAASKAGSALPKPEDLNTAEVVVNKLG